MQLGLLMAAAGMASWGGEAVARTAALDDVFYAARAIAAVQLAGELQQLAGMAVYAGGRRAVGRVFEFWNVVDLLRLGTTLAAAALYFDGGQHDPLAVQASVAVAAMLQWLGMLYFLLPYEHTGPFVLMLVEILFATQYFFVLLTIAVAAATHGFYVLIPRRQPDVETLWRAGYSSANMVLFGRYDDALFDEQPEALGNVAKLVNFVLQIVVTVLLLNLLIGEGRGAGRLHRRSWRSTCRGVRGGEGGRGIEGGLEVHACGP